jgi:hypothetical protein
MKSISDKFTLLKNLIKTQKQFTSGRSQRFSSNGSADEVSKKIHVGIQIRMSQTMDKRKIPKLAT